MFEREKERNKVFICIDGTRSIQNFRNSPILFTTFSLFFSLKAKKEKDNIPLEKRFESV